jgi:hypothetical protein
MLWLLNGDAHMLRVGLARGVKPAREHQLCRSGLAQRVFKVGSGDQGLGKPEHQIHRFPRTI